MAITTLEKLISYIERGLERAENEQWCVLTLLADAETETLLEDLKRVQARLDEGAGGT